MSANRWIVVVIGLLALLGGALLYQGQSRASVTRMTWYREVHVARWQTVTHTGEHPPAGARILDTWTEYERKCSGTGEKRKCRDDWDQVYRYETDQWVFNRSLVRKGDGPDAVWPNVEDLRYPDDLRRPGLGDEALTAQIEHYTLHFSDGGEYACGFQTWSAYRVGDSVALTRNGFGFIVRVDP